MSIRRKKKKQPRLKPYILFGLSLTVILILIVSTIGRQQLNTPQRLGLNIIGHGQSLLTRTGALGSRIWQRYVVLWGIYDENIELRSQLDASRKKNNEFREAMATNVQLKRLISLKQSIQSPTLSADVVGRDPSLWFRTLIINRGSRDGVEKGMPVVCDRGVVGQIFDTSPDFAKVLLATDPNSAINVLVQKNRVQGILKGLGKEYNLQYIMKNANVEEGDAVVTSGLSGIFPKGLLVGHVSKVVNNKRGMFQQITIKPAVNFSRLEFLVIIQKENSLARQGFMGKIK